MELIILAAVVPFLIVGGLFALGFIVMGLGLLCDIIASFCE